MKTNSLILSALVCIGLAAPAMADGMAAKGKSALGSSTAFVVDVPEGMVVDSTVKCPVKCTRSLAEAFGDEKGWKQKIVGTLFGVPSGAVFGVPYGCVAGGKHALSTGWDKPFSKESFVVCNVEK